jgi:hypothetical protein
VDGNQPEILILQVCHIRGNFNCQYEIIVVIEPRCNSSRSFDKFVLDRRRKGILILVYNSVSSEN